MPARPPARHATTAAARRPRGPARAFFETIPRARERTCVRKYYTYTCVCALFSRSIITRHVLYTYKGIPILFFTFTIIIIIITIIIRYAPRHTLTHTRTHLLARVYRWAVYVTYGGRAACVAGLRDVYYYLLKTNNKGRRPRASGSRAR